MAAARAQVAGPPLRRLTVLYDPDCRLCVFASGWLARQRQLVPLDLVPVGSPEAVRRFPALDHKATRNEVTVVGDAGQVYRGDSAWIVCLWALADHREFSHTLTSPAGRRLARAAVLRAAKYRESRGGQPAREREQRGPAARPTYAPGWLYDPVSGWTQSDVTAAPEQCGDGCSPAG
jgi:predicted DCC family thiol-disulfide oxidoreductase YuxK